MSCHMKDKHKQAYSAGSDNSKWTTEPFSTFLFCFLFFYLRRIYTRSAEDPEVLCVKVMDAVGFLYPPDN